MLESSCPGGTLAEVAEELWFGCLLNPSTAFARFAWWLRRKTGRVIWIVCEISRGC